MSKYTTEVRFICESKSGLNESTGASDVDTVIANSWNKIFTSKISFFDETYRSVLCSKILKHYYLREICCETIGIWVLWMNTKLEEIMPYYNQLYESAKIKFNPMHDIDLTRDHSGNKNETRTETNDTGITLKNSANSSINTKNLYSDTPQGGLTGIDSDTYLTSARKISESNITENNVTTNTTENVNGTNTTTNDYIEKISGKQGSDSFSSLLNEYRSTMLNIDMQVIEEFNELFINLW